MKDEEEEYYQTPKVFTNNEFVVLFLFMLIVILFLVLSVRELLRIYKFSRWIGPFPNVARSPPISYQLDNYLDDIYMGLAQIKKI
jgi:hypothetical protein